MIVIMKVGASKAQVEAVVANIRAMRLDARVIVGQERTVIAVVGDDRSAIDRGALSVMDGVERTMPVLAPYKIASREVHPANTLIRLNGTAIGDTRIALIAGPRAVISRGQILELAHDLKEAGVLALSGGVFDPQPLHYASQGLGEKGLEYLAEAREQTGLPIVTEVAEPEMVPMVAQYADVLQIAAHNMQNYPLLNAVGESAHAILLRRGMVNTLEELLMAAEYILARGNQEVIVCEGGIRIYESYTNNVMLDINAVPVLKIKTHLPVFVDVSHAAGNRDSILSASKAAIAAGTDGLIIEVDQPASAAHSASDEARALNPEQFVRLIWDLRRVAEAVDRTM
jgi:3-deoxy-7-phosphoheptulonate synthase